MRTNVLLMLAVLFLAARVQAQIHQTPVAVTQHSEAIAAPPQVKDQFALTLSAGATLNGGNTEAYAANGGGRLVLIRSQHQLSMDVLTTLGYAKNASTGVVDQTSENVLGRLRYDLFLSRNDALFLAMQPRRDIFAGLNVRLQNQIGYLRNVFFPEDAHRLWTEYGYDLTYDDFAGVVTSSVVTNPTDPRFPAPGPNETITVTTSTKYDPGHAIVHSGRVYLGYHNVLKPQASVNLGAETLFDVTDGRNVRVNGMAEFTSSLTERFKLGVQLRILFDNQPVEGVKKKYDTISALQLIYTYDSVVPAQSVPCGPCDCTAQVAAASHCPAKSP